MTANGGPEPSVANAMLAPSAVLRVPRLRLHLEILYVVTKVRAQDERGKGVRQIQRLKAIAGSGRRAVNGAGRLPGAGPDEHQGEQQHREAQYG